MAKEILLAGDDTKIADICKAREFMDQVDGNFKEAQKLYDEYIRNEREINLTNSDLLPFWPVFKAFFKKTEIKGEMAHFWKEQIII